MAIATLTHFRPFCLFPRERHLIPCEYLALRFPLIPTPIRTLHTYCIASALLAWVPSLHQTVAPLGQHPCPRCSRNQSTHTHTHITIGITDVTLSTRLCGNAYSNACITCLMLHHQLHSRLATPVSLTKPMPHPTMYSPSPSITLTIVFIWKVSQGRAKAITHASIPQGIHIP